MKVILYMAISINGRITRGQDDSDWVSKVDWEEFDKLKRESGVLLMGKNTYFQFKDDFPQEGVFNVVLTHDPKLVEKKGENFLFTDMSLEETLNHLTSKGFKQAMLIGGMNTNTQFLKNNLVDEVRLSVHPIFIGEGLNIADKFELFKNLKFIGSKNLDEGLVQLRYKVK